MGWEKRGATLAHVLAPSAFALSGLYAGDNADTFGHLAQGRQIAELGRVPQVDTWSLLPGPPRAWHNYEWLSDLLSYLTYRTFGYDGLIGLKCLLLWLTGWLLLRLARREGGERALLLSALVLVAAIPAVRFRLSDRPHIFGLCFAAIYLDALVRLARDTVDERRRMLSGLFLLHVLWVNLHGSHLLGFGMTAVFTALSARSARKTLLLLLGLELVASCISPYGPHIVLDALAHVFDRRYAALITEWAPWDEADPPWWVLGPALQAAALALVGPRLFRQSGALRPWLALSALLAAAGFRSLRFATDFTLLTAPLVGIGYAALTAQLGERRFAGAVSLCALFEAVLVPWGAAQLPPYRGISHGVASEGLPTGPGAMLARLPRPVRLFSTMENSWYLMWAVPKLRVFIDGRVPFYGPEHVAVSMLALEKPALFSAIARKESIDAVVLNYSFAAERPLLLALSAEPGWTRVLIDDAFALFLRDDLARAAGLTPLTLLQPSFRWDWVLALDRAEPSELARQLSRLTHVPSARGYLAFLRALRALAPLSRGSAQDGFRWPRDAADFARYQRAAEALRGAASLADVPLVAALEANVAAMLCDLPRAHAALTRASERGIPMREAMLAAQEIALREGRAQEVVKAAQKVLHQAGASPDPWLRELARGLEQPPACPAR